MATSLSPRARLFCGLAAGLAAAAYFAFSALLVSRMKRGAGLWEDWPRAAAVLAVSLAAGMAFGMLVVVAPAWLEQRGARPERVVWLRALAPGAMLMVGLMGTMTIARGSLLWAFAEFGFLVVIMIGSGIMSAGHMRREGDSRHCPKCDYEFGFPDESAAPRTCPECNEPWIGRLVRGTRKGSPRLMIAGGVVMCSSFVFVTGGMWGGGVARHLPTSVLIMWASGARFNSAPMAELASRTLTPAQTADLARRLLDRRAADRFSLGVEGKQWLDAQVTAGTLPADLRERFFAEMFMGGVHAPARVRAGEPFTVGLRDTDGADGYTYRCFVCIAGFGVGDEAPTAGRSADAFYPNLIDAADPSPYSDNIPTATLVAAAPGTTVVRAEIWVVVASRSPAPVRWGSDGTPSFSGPVEWVRKVVLEKRVTVTP